MIRTNCFENNRNKMFFSFMRRKIIMANRRQAKKNAAAAVNKEVVKKEAKAVETAEAVKAEETTASVKEETAASVKEEKAVPVKKEAAEKAEQPKKAPGRKAAVKEEFVLEFAGKQITQDEIRKKVKENWTKVQKNKIKDIKTIKVFLQPENSCAYYTINDEGNDSYKIEL